jgi:hypothetical protein
VRELEETSNVLTFPSGGLGLCPRSAGRDPKGDETVRGEGRCTPARTALRLGARGGRKAVLISGTMASRPGQRAASFSARGTGADQFHGERHPRTNKLGTRLPWTSSNSTAICLRAGVADESYECRNGADAVATWSEGGYCLFPPRPPVWEIERRRHGDPPAPMRRGVLTRPFRSVRAEKKRSRE